MNFNFPSTKGNLEAQGLTHSSFVKKVSSAGAHSPASKSPVQTMFFASAYYPSSLVLSIQVASENYFVLLVSLSPQFWFSAGLVSLCQCKLFVLLLLIIPLVWVLNRPRASANHLLAFLIFPLVLVLSRPGPQPSTSWPTSLINNCTFDAFLL